jgi:hypothetical protein
VKFPQLAALALVGAVLSTAPAVEAQQAARPKPPAPTLVGTWKAKTGPARPAAAKGKPAAPAPVQLVVIRPDSSASYGREVVRWRLKPKGDEVMLAIGGEWVTYKMKLKGAALTLSGGDLPEPVTLTRVGPPTPRPAGMKVPADPDTEAY